MTDNEKEMLRYIEGKLIDVMAIHGHTADVKMVSRLCLIQSMLEGLRTADQAKFEVGE